MYLAYDTETNGLPLDPGSKDFYDTFNWPRVYQIGAIMFDDMGFEEETMNEIIRPDNWKIPKQEFFLERGITTEYLMDVGKPINKVLPMFIEMANASDELVCHNASFDNPVMVCEFFRLKHFPQHWSKKPQHCTKLMTEPILKLPGFKPGQYKWPTLQEAYVHFFGHEFDGAHDAMADVRATVDVFMEIKDIGLDDLYR